MKNVIISSSDSKYGDFLIDHWLKSLKENVNLSNIDLVILDYGLSPLQVKSLKKEGVLVVKCVRDGHVVILRFRDMLKFLKNKKYDQVLSIDGGDIIFQGDLSNIFNEHQNDFRVVKENLGSHLINFPLYLTYFSYNDAKHILKTLKNKPLINAGVIFAPSNKFQNLCKEVFSMVKNKDLFGPDQILINYLFYKNGFISIDEKYNFIPCTAKNNFYVKDGVFYFKNKIKINIVHNAGNKDFFRFINSFGYGQEFNKIKKINLFLLRKLLSIKKLFNFY